MIEDIPHSNSTLCEHIQSYCKRRGAHIPILRFRTLHWCIPMPPNIRRRYPFTRTVMVFSSNAFIRQLAMTGRCKHLLLPYFQHTADGYLTNQSHNLKAQPRHTPLSFDRRTALKSWPVLQPVLDVSLLQHRYHSRGDQLSWGPTKRDRHSQTTWQSFDDLTWFTQRALLSHLTPSAPIPFPRRSSVVRVFEGWQTWSDDVTVHR